MPTDSEIKQQIDNAIKTFAKQSLAESAFTLFESLGYRSQKRLSLQPNTPKQFCAEFDIGGELKEKALLSEWKQVEFLFQLTDDEINASLGQKLFIPSKKVDNTVINSYLFFALQLENEQYTRTQLADITREVNKLFSMPVMILFQYGYSLTLSIISRRLNKRDASKKDVLEKVTLIKDISVANPHRAHLEILFDLSISKLNKEYGFTNFVELQRAWENSLDTSELNKKFYREVANWYFWAVQNVKFPVGDNNDTEENRNAINVIRLITRFIFVWFLREKKLVPEELFIERKIRKMLKFEDSNNSTYYKAILQNLFFATLNQEMNTRQKPDNRKFRIQNKLPGGRDRNRLVTNLYRYERYFNDPISALNLFSKIPFLNGGLFECLDKETEKDGQNVVIRIDGFSDEDKNPLSVPDDLFFSDEKEVDLNSVYDTRNKRYHVCGLIHILNRYKFTIEENTPITEEIALDPELLGKVFENLLASFNPETRTTARKQTGSYYTPREIVSYMVDESLIAYFENFLTTKINNHQLISQPNLIGTNQSMSCAQQDIKSRLRHLLSYNESAPIFSEEETVCLIVAIDSLKALDPACGSGAFPMGILHKLVLILSRLDPGNERWKQKQIDKANEIPDTIVREKVIADIEQTFTDNELDYGRKLYLIENCIYGVDIQPIAVQISKLRFFISLIVDQKINNNYQYNNGIRPLPNLETKFVAANTLIGIGKSKQLVFHNSEIEKLEKDLAEIRKKHFDARTLQSKRKYRDEDFRIRRQISLLLEDGFPRETTEKLAQWNPYDQNDSASFFDPVWMFSVEDGFDIVIGNPPYVSYGLRGTQSLVNADKSSLRTLYPNSAEYKISLYAIFMDKGIQLSKISGGIHTFIVPDSFLLGRYFSAIRKFILNNCHIREIVLLPFSVFEATVGFSVVYLLKRIPCITEDLLTTSKLAPDKESFQHSYFKAYQFPQIFYSTRPYNRFVLFFNSDTLRLVKKIEENTDELGKYITFGSGLISNTSQKNIVALHKKDNDWLPGIISGGEISRYSVKPVGHYIYYKKNVIKSGYENIDYFTEKLFLRQTGDSLICAYDDENLLALNNIHIGNITNPKYPLKIILAIINSKLMNYYYRSISLETGRAMAQTDIETIEKLPIKRFLDIRDNEEIISIVDAIISAKKTNSENGVSELEDRLDKLIYKIYNIDEYDISFIEQDSIFK